MPDNWNILASLLGTPRPPEPPAAEAKQEELTSVKSNESPTKTASEPRSFVEKMTDKISDFVRGEDEHSRSQRTVSATVSRSEPPVEDVLQALTAVQPPPKLPGFGVQREAEATPDVGFGRREAEIQKRERQLSAGREESPARQRDDRQRRGPQDAHPPRSRRDGGFAMGLGSDSCDDDDLRGVEKAIPAMDDDATISGDDSPTQILEPTTRRESQPRRGRSSRERTETGRSDRNDQRSSPPPRRTSAFVEESLDEDLDEVVAELVDEAEVSEDSNRGPSRRRRGRRGQRQRMSVDELDDVVEAEVIDTTDEERAAEPEVVSADTEKRGRRRRGGRGGRGRDRDREATNDDGPKDSSKDRSGTTRVTPPERTPTRGQSAARHLDAVRHEPPATKTSMWGDDDLDDELESFDRPEIDLFDDSEEIVPSVSVESDDEEGPSAGRRRSRRGGRRRGRGGSASRSESDPAPATGRGPAPRSTSNANIDDEPVSEFDDEDDLLDDDLVSREGRSRRSQTRTEQPPRNAPRARDESRARSESRPATERADFEASPRSKPIPTWKEIVNLMVDGNLKNRGGGRGPRSSGGGQSSGGGRRR